MRSHFLLSASILLLASACRNESARGSSSTDTPTISAEQLVKKSATQPEPEPEPALNVEDADDPEEDADDPEEPAPDAAEVAAAANTAATNGKKVAHPAAPQGTDSDAQGSSLATKSAATEKAKEPAEAKEMPLKSGAAAKDAAFSVWLEGPSEVVVGKPSGARARVLAHEPYKCNEKYPAKFTWDTPKGYSVKANKVTGMSVSGKSGTLALPFSATQAGPLTLSGTLSFSVCTKANCRVEKRQLRLSTKAIPRD